MSQRIFLIGLPGAGKTVMGLKLAVSLGYQFVDLDQEIEKNTRQSISEIFEKKGETWFRQLEKDHLEKKISASKSFVMATGGGTPCFFSNMEIMKKVGITVYVNTPMEIIAKRLKGDTIRPLMAKNSLSKLLEKRKKWYSQADYTIREYIDFFKIF